MEVLCGGVGGVVQLNKMSYPIIKILVTLTAVILVVVLYQTQKPLPDGVSIEGNEYKVPVQSVHFLADRTYVDSTGQRHSEQEIFSGVLAMINEAEKYILLDMFLYNDFQGKPPETTRALAGELTQALIAKKQANPGMTITVVSDPLNTVYGGALSSQFESLRQHGINVIITDLTSLRDSNPGYSAIWRTVFQWFGNTRAAGFMPHPFSAGGHFVTIRSWLSLLNFKANHRKLIVADEPQPNGTTKLVTLVTSANPHDGSSAHGNVAIKVADKLWQDAIVSEQAVGRFSGGDVPGFLDTVIDGDGAVTVQLLTEGVIERKLVELIDRTQDKDTIDVAMFYLSERSIVTSLIRAANRGVQIRLVLDPNRDAFGHTKNGVPNRPVAHELVTKSEGKIQIRWCDTHGEQCHSKLVLIHMGTGDVMMAGSANLTRRNIGDYNLETNILVAADEEIPAMVSARSYMEEIWHNPNGKTFTANYEAYADSGWFKQLLYRIQEATGLSSF